MARGVNKVILIGNLGQDPEVRFLPSGDPVANISIATTDTWTDKQSGQKQERTEWHRCNAFGKLAEIMQQYLRKGSKIYVEGSLHARKWQDQQGVDRYSTEIKIRDMQMLDGQPQGQQQGGYPQGGPQGGGGFAQPQGGGYGAPQGQAPQGQQAGNGYRNARQGQGGNAAGPAPGQQQPPAQQGNYGAPAPGAYDDFNDEIPFD